MSKIAVSALLLGLVVTVAPQTAQATDYAAINKKIDKLAAKLNLKAINASIKKWRH